MPIIYSTLAANVIYNLHEIMDEGRNLPIELARVEIKGGAGVANPTTIQTPKGVATLVTDEQLAVLEKNHCFQQHVHKNFIKVDRDAQKEKHNVNEVAKDLNRDKSSPRTPEDYAEFKEEHKPILNSNTISSKKK
jgi:hypothetical protein